ncbi:hypothetical protein A1F99_029390 [Pyrenophora tritici-repentis]|nr:hypothetical protein A1F99_029390 [Pyrenophora tritici-repentis]
MVKKAADDVQSSDAYGKSIEVVGNATESVKNVVAEGSQQAQDLVEKSKDAAGDAYSKSAQTVETAAETASSTAQDMYNKGKQMFTQSQDAAGEAMENAKTAASDASQQARDAVVDAKVRDINGPDSGIKE